LYVVDPWLLGVHEMVAGTAAPFAVLYEIVIVFPDGSLTSFNIQVMAVVLPVASTCELPPLP
jgi:hypothetical protein